MERMPGAAAAESREERNGPSEEESPCAGCGRRTRESRCAHCGAALWAGAFKVRRVLGQSPYSRTYLARGADAEDVVLKELLFTLVPDIQQIEAFEREARLIQGLSHPSIPKLLAFFQEGTGVHLRLYRASEFVPGASLLERIKLDRFSEKQARGFARQVLQILSYLICATTSPESCSPSPAEPKPIRRLPGPKVARTEFPMPSAS